MLTQQTLEKMNAMKLQAMAEAFQQHRGSSEYAKLSFEERVGLLVDSEWTAREQRKLASRLRAAKPRYRASLEDVDFKHSRGLDRQQVLGLGSCSWIQDRHNLVITGATGIGKSYLVSAFVERACRRGFTARYVRMPRLLHELAVGRGDGSFIRLLSHFAKLDLLVIDDVYRGYDSDDTRALLRWLGIEPVIAKRNTEHGSGLGKIRWVVERTISWVKGLRRMRVRYDRLKIIQDAWNTLAAAVICFRIACNDCIL